MIIAIYSHLYFFFAEFQQFFDVLLTSMILSSSALQEVVDQSQGRYGRGPRVGVQAGRVSYQARRRSGGGGTGGAGGGGWAVGRAPGRNKFSEYDLNFI